MPLFSPFAPVHLSPLAVLKGVCPGEVFAATGGEIALLFSPEGAYLAGPADNPSANAALRGLIADTLTTIEDDVLIVPATTAWDNALTALCPVSPDRIMRRFYVAETAPPVPALPVGFTLRPINALLLADARLVAPDHVSRWATSNFGSVEAFLAHGFGYCMVEENTGMVASWSLTDAVADGRCEIGIHTHKEQRRRGLAAAVVSAMVRHTLNDAGLTAVGWHCDETNVASWRTAERAGLRHAANYVQYRCACAE